VLISYNTPVIPYNTSGSCVNTALIPYNTSGSCVNTALIPYNTSGSCGLSERSIKRAVCQVFPPRAPQNVTRSARDRHETHKTS
jgi:hypothetical protein